MLLCQEPSAPTTISKVKYGTSPSNSYKVLQIILFGLAGNTYKRETLIKSYVDTIVYKQLNVMPFLCNTNALFSNLHIIVYVYQPKLQRVIL